MTGRSLERGSGLADDFAREGNGVGEQAVFAREAIDQAGVPWPARRDRIALGGHLERELDAGDARQALGAAGAGEEAELDLGQAELRRGDGDAIMAGERDLAAAAERGAMDRGDHRLVERFDLIDQHGERRAPASACRIR